MKLDPVSARYAFILQILAIVGIALLAVTFVLYITGVVPSPVDPEDVTKHWHLNAEAYGEYTGQSLGWSWIKHIFTGEGLSFAALVFLGLATVVCLGFVLPTLISQKDYRYTSIVAAQILVLLAAASGIVTFH